MLYKVLNEYEVGYVVIHDVRCLQIRHEPCVPNNYDGVIFESPLSKYYSLAYILEKIEKHNDIYHDELRWGKTNERSSDTHVWT